MSQGDLKIFRVDDGALYYIAAPDAAGARAVWVQVNIDVGGYANEAAVVEEFGEPTITLVQLVAAAVVRVELDDETVACSNCGGTGQVAKYETLLETFHRQTAPGVMSCSEWP